MISIFKFRKMIATVVALTMSCFLLCSCKSANDNNVISTNDTWYDTERIELELPSNISANTEIKTKKVYYLDNSDEYVVYMNGWEDIDEFEKIYHYDNQGQIISSIDLNCIVDENSHIESITLEDSNLYALVFSYDSSIGDSVYSICTISLDLGSIVSSVNLNLDETLSGEFFSQLFVCDEVFVAIPQFNNTGILLFDIDGNYQYVDLERVFNDDSFMYWDPYITDDSRLILMTTLDGKEYQTDIPIGNRNINISTQNFILGNSYQFGINAANDGNVYGVSGCGISKLNNDTSKYETIISTAEMNINTYELEYSTVIFAESNKYVLVNSFAPDTEIIINKLSPAESNPNAGKQLLVAGLVDYQLIPEFYANAVYDFNNSDSDIFIVIKAYDYQTVYNPSFSIQSANDAKTQMVNVLKTEILDGSGPDIILNGFDMLQLNSDDYLIDLGQYYTGEDGIDPASVFENIIEASYDGNSLYQFPISFSYTSIVSSVENATGDMNGFTYDNYYDYLYEYNYGIDPLSERYGRLDYFDECVISINNLIYDNSTETWSFDSEAFCSLANFFVENNIRQIPYTEEEMAENPNFNIESLAHCSELYTFTNYCYSRVSHRYLYGIPSYNGNGIIAKCIDSAAITSCCSNVSASWRFIKSLTMRDSYECIATPINRDYVINHSAEDLAVVNASYGSSNPRLQQEWAEEELLDEYLRLVDNISNVYRMNGEILAIINEEMPSYFEGQKTLDEVIEIIENRVSTYVSENN